LFFGRNISIHVFAYATHCIHFAVNEKRTHAE
jgi:hypothetical protein